MKPTTLLTAALAILPASVLAHSGHGPTGLLTALHLHATDLLLLLVAVAVWPVSVAVREYWRNRR